MSNGQARKDARQGAIRTARCARCGKLMGEREARWHPDHGALCKKCTARVRDQTAGKRSPAS